MLGPLDMFSIGIGPSSSHTIGPMRAAARFVDSLKTENKLIDVCRLEANLFGSLALTGSGHGTCLAVINGLLGEDPETVDPEKFITNHDNVKSNNELLLSGINKIKFDYENDLILHYHEFLPQHANGMRFIAYNQEGGVLLQHEYFSIGGGFIVDEEEILHVEDSISKTTQAAQPYPFSTAVELIELCTKHNLTIAELVTQNALVEMSEEEFKQKALAIIQVMLQSVENGVASTDPILPGGLNVTRRAPKMYQKLNTKNIHESGGDQRLMAMAFAMAVNEENASFHRIVTAPTNGSAGTIPGVLEYYKRFCEGATLDKMIELILTAGAIGMLYKMGASISAAEVGCQGEIGVSCSMAAAGLTAVLGGSVTQVATAAEIAMEHSLGMTCDPVGGLVQIPCIERNGVAATRAIDVANLVLLEDTPGKISLDTVIKTMMQTGKDMGMHYKETSLGGLAVNIATC